MFRRTGLSRIHFVGIGGAGMSGIAEVLRVSDVPLAVSGCDLVESEVTRHLRNRGIDVSLGHSPDHVRDAELVVISSAVGEDNEEVRAARQLGVPVIRRAEMLAELMRLKYGIAIAGTHGKTTTTSLVGDGADWGGGSIRQSSSAADCGSRGTGARLGTSDYLVVEADEFDRSFLRLQPIVAVITTIDLDHLDTYRDLGEIQDAFVSFAGRVPFFGQAIVCLDDPRIQEILPRLADRRESSPTGSRRQADLVAFGHRDDDRPAARFHVRACPERRPRQSLDLPMPGTPTMCRTRWRQWRWV